MRSAEGEPEASSRGSVVSKGEVNTDKILISAEGAFKAETDGLTKSIVGAMEGPTAPEKLQAIQDAVDAGSYYIPTEKLVDALMQRWIGMA